MKKIVGIIGGVGPYAGVDFHRKLLDSTPANIDQEHLEIYHLSASERIGDRSAFLQDNSLPHPAQGFIYVAQKLLSIGAKILAIPCNTAHSEKILSPFLDFLQTKDAMFLNLVEESCLHIKSLKLGKVGLLSTLGTYGSGVYESYFAKTGCGELLYPSDNDKEIVNRAIYDPQKGVKSGAEISWARQKLNEVSQGLIRQGAQAIIMGCTEIPLAMRQQDFLVPLLDPGLILAKRIVKEVL